MRIAMLSSIARPTVPGETYPLEHAVSTLTEGLVRRGLDVTLFATLDSRTGAKLAGVCPKGFESGRDAAGSAWESLHIAELFERGDEFDLIHNWFGHLPLTYLRMTSTPVLTTIHLPPSEIDLPVYRKYNRLSHYVSAGDIGRHPDLDYLATVPCGIDGVPFTPEQLVEDYLGIYRKIHADRGREDHRPWGFYKVLEDEPRHKVKRIVVYPGQRLSLQRHQRRAEHWLVVEGRARVVRNDEILELETGEAVDIPRRAWHRVMNPGNVNMAFIEVQTGDYFGEDDIERSEDDYGRAG